MKEKKESKAAETAKKVTIKADKIIAVYNIINRRTSEQEIDGKRVVREGFKLSALETKDIFVFLRARNTLKPIAEAYADFQKTANEDLKPENWDEIVEKSRKFDELPEAERIAVNKAIMDYQGKVSECIGTELEKEKELDAYEHLSEEAFGALVKDNRQLDAFDIALLQEILA